MEIRSLAIFSFFVAFSICKGLVLVGEDKRQGLIPFPRVGRGPSWLQTLPSFQSLTDFDGTGATASADDDLFAVRFARGLYTPRLGRRKRSLDGNNANGSNDSNEGRHVRSTSTLIPRYLYDVDGNQVDLRQLMRKSPWAILAYKDGMEKKTAFNPRLGRAMVPRLGRKRSSPDQSSSNIDVTMTSSDDDDVLSNDQLEKRAMAFSPRLGRADGLYSLPAEVQMRGGRAFSPRLGRSDGTNENAEQQSSA